MRVLHVIWDLGQGGAQTYLRDLVKASLALNRISVAVLVLTDRGPLSEDIEILGVPVEYANIRHGADIYRYMQLFNYFRKARYDIIHSHSSNFLFNCMLWTSTSRKVFTEHGGELMGGEWKCRLFYKIFHRNYLRFIAISESMRYAMINAKQQVAGRIRLIYNGLDFKLISSIEPHKGYGLPKEIILAKHRVGIVARLVPQKGVSTFLETAAALAKSNAGMVFVVVGEGPQRKELVDMAEQLNIGDRVFFLGYRKDAKRILKILDVFLLTSEWEPFGLVITEAMALRVPVVALNRKGGANEILRNGVDGFLVDKKEPSRLAQFVMKIIDDRTLREQFVRSAYKRVEHCFSIDQNARELIDIYMECLSS